MARKSIPKSIELSVVGVDHRVSQSTRRMIAAHLPLKCDLEREPKNFKDPNAIKVVITEPGSPYKDFHIGYLRKEVASVYAPVIDRGEVAILECKLTELDWHGSTGTVNVRLQARIPQIVKKRKRVSNRT